jgi:hypothetical protein
LSIAAIGGCCPDRDGGGSGYRLDLFHAGELMEIRLFEDHELAQAKASATAAMRNGSADRAEVRDDLARLVFVGRIELDS